MQNKKREITKIILKGLLLTGGIIVASTSPYFVSKILPKLIRYASYKLKEREKKKFYDTFYYLKSKGLINFKYRGKQLYISLTKEGRKKAGKYQIDDLEIKKPKKWDKVWRILIFDIEEKHRIKRESLRGKLKELGLFQLQKSVWACPYNFQNEINILRSFLNLSSKEMQVVTALRIEEDSDIKMFFGIK